MQSTNPFDVILDKIEQLQVTVETLSIQSPKVSKETVQDANRLIDLVEAAEVLRKPVGTVRSYIHSRNLPATLIGKSYLIKYSELLKWFEEFNAQSHAPTHTAPQRMINKHNRYRKGR